MLSVDVIKRDGKRFERFSKDKLHDSIVTTCLSIKVPEGQARQIADKVCSNVIIWLETRPEVTSKDLRVTTSKHLSTLHPEAAYLYEQYRITI